MELVMFIPASEGEIFAQDCAADWLGKPVTVNFGRHQGREAIVIDADVMSDGSGMNLAVRLDGA